MSYKVRNYTGTGHYGGQQARYCEYLKKCEAV